MTQGQKQLLAVIDTWYDECLSERNHEACDLLGNISIAIRKMDDNDG